MDLLTYKVIAALLILLVALVAAYFPIKKKLGLPHSESLELGEALASGIFLGAVFFHLLPDAIQQFHAAYTTLIYPVPELICVSGFLLLLLLERLSLSNGTNATTNTIPYLLALMLGIHALTEGAALGIGATLPETIMLMIAIFAHKGSESYALCITLIRHNVSIRQIILIIFLFSLTTPIGILLGNTIHDLTLANRGAALSGCLNAFAAGTFLYISTLHHTHFHKHAKDTQGLLEFASLVFGVIAMATIAIWT